MIYYLHGIKHCQYLQKGSPLGYKYAQGKLLYFVSRHNETLTKIGHHLKTNVFNEKLFPIIIFLNEIKKCDAFWNVTKQFDFSLQLLQE